MMGWKEIEGNWYFSQIRLFEEEKEDLLPEANYVFSLFPIIDNDKPYKVFISLSSYFLVLISIN